MNPQKVKQIANGLYDHSEQLRRTEDLCRERGRTLEKIVHSLPWQWDGSKNHYEEVQKLAEYYCKTFTSCNGVRIHEESKEIRIRWEDNNGQGYWAGGKTVPEAISRMLGIIETNKPRHIDPNLKEEKQLLEDKLREYKAQNANLRRAINNLSEIINGEQNNKLLHKDCCGVKYYHTGEFRPPKSKEYFLSEHDNTVYCNYFGGEMTPKYIVIPVNV